MAQYKEGTVDIQKDSQLVTGVGTAFLSNVQVGNLFKVSGSRPHYMVGEVLSDDQLMLTGQYLQESVTGVAYSISRDFTPALSLLELSPGDYDVLALITESLRRIDSYVGTLALIAGGNLPVLPDLDNDYVLISLAGQYTWQLRTDLVTSELTPAERAAAGEITQIIGYLTAGGDYDEATLVDIAAKQTEGWPDYAIWVNVVGTSSGSFGSFTIPGVSLQPLVAALSLTGAQQGSFALPGLSLQPAVSAPSLSGLSGGGFTLPSVLCQPAVAAPSLVGFQQGSFAIPAVALQPVVSASLLMGTQQGSFTPPSVTLHPVVAAPSLTGLEIAAFSGLFSMSGVTLQPIVTTPSLAGKQRGSFAMPAVSLRPIMAVPSLTGVSVFTLNQPWTYADSYDPTTNASYYWGFTGASPGSFAISTNRLVMTTYAGIDTSRGCAYSAGTLASSAKTYGCEAQCAIVTDVDTPYLFQMLLYDIPSYAQQVALRVAPKGATHAEMRMVIGGAETDALTIRGMTSFDPRVLRKYEMRLVHPTVLHVYVDGVFIEEFDITAANFTGKNILFGLQNWNKSEEADSVITVDSLFIY